MSHYYLIILNLKINNENSVNNSGLNKKQHKLKKLNIPILIIGSVKWLLHVRKILISNDDQNFTIKNTLSPHIFYFLLLVLAVALVTFPIMFIV